MDRVTASDYTWYSDFLKALVLFFLASEAVFWAHGSGPPIIQVACGCSVVGGQGGRQWTAGGGLSQLPLELRGLSELSLKDLGTTPVAPSRRFAHQIVREWEGAGQVSRNPCISLLLQDFLTLSIESVVRGQSPSPPRPASLNSWLQWVPQRTDLSSQTGSG